MLDFECTILHRNRNEEILFQTSGMTSQDLQIIYPFKGAIHYLTRHYR